VQGETPNQPCTEFTLFPIGYIGIKEVLQEVRLESFERELEPQVFGGSWDRYDDMEMTEGEIDYR